MSFEACLRWRGREGCFLDGAFALPFPFLGTAGSESDESALLPLPLPLLSPLSEFSLELVSLLGGVTGAFLFFVCRLCWRFVLQVNSLRGIFMHCFSMSMHPIFPPFC